MSRIYFSLLAGITVLILARDTFAAEPTDSWVGQKVLARKAGTSLTDTGKDGKQVTLPVRHLVYTVVTEDGDRIRVNYPGQEGWAAKVEWVRLPDAMDHFTARIKADPKARSPGAGVESRTGTRESLTSR